MRTNGCPALTESPALTASASTLPPTCAATVLWRRASRLPSSVSVAPAVAGCKVVVGTGWAASGRAAASASNQPSRRQANAIDLECGSVIGWIPLWVS